MRYKLPGIVEHGREIDGQFGSRESDGPNGRFFIMLNGIKFCIIASDGLGWEHVSVSIPGAKRCPTWEEMCAIKNLFWDPEETVVQYHPRASQYVNCHPYVLHLWKPVGEEIKTPPAILVGPRKRH